MFIFITNAGFDPVGPDKSDIVWAVFFPHNSNFIYKIIASDECDYNCASSLPSNMLLF